MKELIKVNYENERPTVSARELHKFLEATERFSNWFERATQYGIIENEDYVGCKVFNTQARQDLQDYQLTIEAAKEIAMIQRNDKGKMARKYFIGIEKAWNDPVLIMGRALELQKKKTAELAGVNEMNKPKVLFADAVSTSETTILVGELAKLLKGNGIDIGQNRLYEKLRNEGFLIKRKGTDYNAPDLAPETCPNF